MKNKIIKNCMDYMLAYEKMYNTKVTSWKTTQKNLIFYNLEGKKFMVKLTDIENTLNSIK